VEEAHAAAVAGEADTAYVGVDPDRDVTERGQLLPVCVGCLSPSHMADLTAWRPHQKASKQDRVASVEAGREDREGCFRSAVCTTHALTRRVLSGYWDKKKAEKTSGTNNKEKLKTKPYLMARQSARVRAKLNMSM
jgi:hypothetical protein